MKINLFVLFLFFNLNGISNTVDSLKTEFHKTTNYNKKNSILNDLADQYITFDIDSALIFSKKALELSVQHSNFYELARSLINIGAIYDSDGRFDLSYKYYAIAKHISKKFAYWDLLSDCYNNLGVLYIWDKNQTKTSLRYLKKSLYIENYQKKYFETAITHYNIGNIYLSLDSIDLASYHFEKAIEISTKANCKEGELWGIISKIDVFIIQNDLDNAFFLSIKAIEISKEVKSNMASSALYFSMGTIYKEQSDYSSAIMAFDSCIAYAEKIGEKNLIEMGYNEISDAYFLIKDYKNAYKYARLYEQIKDEINREKIGYTIAEIEAKSLIEQKEKEIGYLNITKNLYKRISESEKRNKYFLLLVFVFAITLAISNLHRILSDTKSIVLSVFIAIAVMLLITTGVNLLGFVHIGYSQFSFFSVFVDVLTVATFPIFFIVLILERIMLNKNIKTAKSISRQIKAHKALQDRTIVNFQFKNDSNTLSLAIKDLICIEANDNYAAFYYYYNDTVHNTLFRATLKSIEEQLKEHKDVIRCHKSFIVNISYINHITGNAKGYKLHIEEVDFEIPVSRNFPQEILNKIKNEGDVY